jgi:hypothetical protein
MSVSSDKPATNSLLKDYTLQKQFYMIDNNKENSAKNLYYIFNMYSKSNDDPNSDETIENEFMFDMYKYNKNYPTTTFGETIDMTDIEFEKENSHVMIDTVLQPIKLKNNFYKAEMEINRNDCLTLFLFLDSEESTKMEMLPEYHDVYFDFRNNSNNQFGRALINYWGHSKESFDVIYNDMPKDDEFVYLKVTCPYYSVYGDNTISFKLTLYQHTYILNSNIFGFGD